MKKIIISLIFFFSFFNGVYPNGYLDTNLHDTDEATIEIESARLDENNLQISWLVSGLENIDELIISVRELTSDGLQGEPLRLSITLKRTKNYSMGWDYRSFDNFKNFIN